MMKKMIGLLCVLLVSGCSLAAKEDTRTEKLKMDIEDGAVLTITLPDASYGKALQKLWNTTYPNHAHALHIQVEPYAFSQHIKGDIAWTNDRNVYFQQDEAMDIQEIIEDVEMPWPQHLERKENQNLFMPVSGQGLIFTINTYNAEKRGIPLSDFEEMETLEEYERQGYYQNRLPDYVYPLLFQDYDVLEEGSVSQNDLLESEAFKEQLHQYRTLQDTMFLVDDPVEKDTFYLDDHYLCGLVENDGAYEETEEYQNGHLRFTTMPEYNGEPLSPLLDTYGFIVNKNTRYPHAVKAFLHMVRSREGILHLLDHTHLYPLVRKEDIEDLQIFDANKKQILETMNDSRLRSNTYIQEKPSIAVDTLFQKSDFYSILQNSLYTKDPDDVVIKRMVKDMNQWIYRQ